MLSYEYIHFLNEQILNYLPADKVRHGDKWNCRCMFCGDSKKSKTKKRFWFYTKTASVYCFNCGIAMSGIKFLEAISGSSFEDIRREYTKLFLKSGLNNSLSSVYEIPNREPTLFDFKSIVKPEWKLPLSENAKEYLSKRKVLEAPFLADKFYSWYSSKKQEYILIPWNVGGCEGAYFQLNDFQKNGNLKYIFPKNKKKLLFGLDNIDLSFPYVICLEGVYDSLFIKNGIATGTKAITEDQIKLIKEHYPQHNIVISFDNDESGIASMIKSIKQNKNFKYFLWFNKNTKQKDINEYVLYKNNVNVFSKSATIEKMCYSPLQAKLMLMNNGLWK